MMEMTICSGHPTLAIMVGLVNEDLTAEWKEAPTLSMLGVLTMSPKVKAAAHSEIM